MAGTRLQRRPVGVGLLGRAVCPELIGVTDRAGVLVGLCTMARAVLPKLFDE